MPPDEVNQIDWNNVTLYKSTVNFVKELIRLKTQEEAFLIRPMRTSVSMFMLSQQNMDLA